MYTKQFFFERCLPAVVFASLLLAGCGDQHDPQDPSDYYGQPQHSEVEDPIGFTDQNYDFTGPTPIADIEALFTSTAPVWYGFSPLDRYPQGDERVLDADCDAGSYSNVVDKIDELPARIEGVVTLHPRYFQKVPVCGQDQRFYGSFFLQDESGGMLVLKDSRVADFTFGDRVSLRVRGVMSSFGQPAVVIYDDQEVIEQDEREDIYYEDIGREFETSDIGKVRRIEGEVTSEPNNDNFNELVMEGDDGSVWSVSIDRELGNRGVALPEGERVRLTGPVIESYGLSLLVGSLGQIERLDEE